MHCCLLALRHNNIFADNVLSSRTFYLWHYVLQSCMSENGSHIYGRDWGAEHIPQSNSMEYSWQHDSLMYFLILLFKNLNKGTHETWLCWHVVLSRLIFSQFENLKKLKKKLQKKKSLRLSPKQTVQGVSHAILIVTLASFWIPYFSSNF